MTVIILDTDVMVDLLRGCLPAVAWLKSPGRRTDLDLSFTLWDILSVSR